MPDVDTAEVFLDDDEINVELVEGFLKGYCRELQSDSSKIGTGTLHWRQGQALLPRGTLFMSFGNWMSEYNANDWWDVVDGDVGNKMRDVVEQYYETNEHFRTVVNKNVEVVDVGGSSLGTYHELKNKDTGDDGDDQVELFREMEEIGLINGDASLIPEAIRGVMLQFARDVDTVEGRREEVNRYDIKKAFDEWMIMKLDTVWIRYTSEMLDPDDLVEYVVDLWKRSDEFSDLVTDKYEYIEDRNTTIIHGRHQDGTKGVTEFEHDNTQSDTVDTGDAESPESAGKSVAANVSASDIDRNTVLCADSTDVVSVLMDMDIRIGAVITDPPYGQGYDARGDEHDVIEGDDDASAAVSLTEEVLKKSKIPLREGSPVVAFAGKSNLRGVWDILDKWYDFKDVNIWSKDWVGTSSIGENPMKWRQNHEYALLACYGDSRIENDNRHDGNVWEFQRLSGDKMEHPTQKPVDLMKYIIRSVTDKGDLVFDPFAGSGSTLVAAKETERDYLGVEYDDEHYELIQKRLAQGALTAYQ